MFCLHFFLGFILSHCGHLNSASFFLRAFFWDFVQSCAQAFNICTHSDLIIHKYMLLWKTNCFCNVCCQIYSLHFLFILYYFNYFILNYIILFIMMYYILYHIVSYYMILNFILHDVVFYSIVLDCCIVLVCFVLDCVALRCVVLHRNGLYCIIGLIVRAMVSAHLALTTVLSNSACPAVFADKGGGVVLPQKGCFWINVNECRRLCNTAHSSMSPPVMSEGWD